jgi:geranylgeranyl reductase family protein
VTHDLFDIAVVGAGPAGSVAAYTAARRGFSVALIDRQTFPRDKACGDGIGPGAVRLVQQLGLGEIFDGYAPIEAVTVLGPNGSRTDNAVPDIHGEPTTGYVVPRLEFDNRLFRAALEAGAEDLSGTRFLEMTALTGTRSVTLRNGSGTRRVISARLVLGADGAYSAVRRTLISRQEPYRSRQAGIAMRAYARSPKPWAAALTPSLMLDFSRDLLPWYGWVFPVGVHKVNIGVGGSLDVMRQRGTDLGKLLGCHADAMRARGIICGELHDRRAHHLPHVGGMPKLTYPRAALIGDAASMINPVSGEGIAYAVTAADQLVRALPAWLDDGDAVAAALTRFEREFRARHRRHFASSRLIIALMRNRACASVLVRAMQRDPRVLSALFDFGPFTASMALRALMP